MKRIGIFLFLFLTAAAFPCFPMGPASNKGTPAPETLFIQQQDSSFSGADRDALLRTTVEYYESSLESARPADSAEAFRQLAFSYAQLGRPDLAADNVRKYLHADFRPAILSSTYFDPVRESPEFREIEASYTPGHSIWSSIYLYVGLIGFYIAAILFLHRKIDRLARLFIGSFVLIHSVFILHISLVIANYQFEYPHTYLGSTAFSFLYGPLLYLYFKRSTQNYSLKPADLLHLAPTLLFLLYLVPIYALSAGEKLNRMLERAAGGASLSESPDLALIVGLKLSSLVFYGWLIRREFLKREDREDDRNGRRLWMRNIYGIHVAYIVCYAIYGLLIIYQDNPGGVLYHAQVMSMSLMVLYVGFFASLRPQVFGTRLALETRIFSKYKKSGLTDSLSLELRDKLLELFDREKVFMENDLNLEGLAERMGTTRHNASQVINEHFHLSFHELLNKYRIDEAKDILRSDYQRNLNIIDIAYEVGYNNKVTFNKAFKKDTSLTPSQFQSQALQPGVKRA